MLATSNAGAQPPAPLQGKKVALYVSKRGITFSENLRKPLAAFLNQADTLGLSEEELKFGLTVQLGNTLAASLNNETGTDSSYFINNRPELARAFISAYMPGSLAFSTIETKLDPRTRYILVIDSLELRTVLRRSFFAVSNRIISERRHVILGRIVLRVFDTQAKRFSAAASVFYDADHHPNPPDYVRLAHNPMDASAFLDDIINLGLQALFEQLN